jgi:transcriptional regulator with XRE-family HTH domain
MDAANSGWAERQAANPEARRAYERERLALWALEAISIAMERGNISKADLARKLGVSRAYITQVLSGSRNMTLNTLADLAWACNSRAQVKVEPLRKEPFISSPVQVVHKVHHRFQQVTSAVDVAKASTAIDTDLLVACK